MENHNWLLFLPQLPSSPSSLRVMVWRRVRAEGGTGLQNGVWVFPNNPERELMLKALVSEIEKQGGGGLLFTAAPLDPSVNQTIMASFRADRDEEYREFCGRCDDFLAEIEKETSARNFSFAEIEENEEDLHKLEGWLRKIQTRDVFGGDQAEQAAIALSRCRDVLHAFTQTVYRQEGLRSDEDDVDAEEPEIGYSGEGNS